MERPEGDGDYLKSEGDLHTAFRTGPDGVGGASQRRVSSEKEKKKIAYRELEAAKAVTGQGDGGALPTRIGLMVRIPRFHRGDPGSIPGCGNALLAQLVERLTVNQEVVGSVQVQHKAKMPAWPNWSRRSVF